VVVPRTAIGSHQYLHVIATDPSSTVYRNAALPEPEVLHRDLRLTKGLDPKRHVIQHDQITVLRAKDKLELTSEASSRFEIYDSINRVYGLYRTLNSDPKLAEFQFLLRWTSLAPEVKRSTYSKYACHELNFFLFKKDPEFFKEVVEPY